MSAGQTILKSNMYSLESGEPSVWDKELGKSAPGDSCSSSGSQLQYKEYVPGTSRSAKKQSTAGPRVKQPATAPSAVEKAASERKLVRSAHNIKLKADKLNAQQRRLVFVKANWEYIKRFVHSKPPTDKEVANLKNLPSYATLTKQPDCLSKGVTMRDYQLAGINWLIKAYESGISVILGDEM
jgi:SWI/SNF-related matrix-associated actin-dependent regulator of chromatin subfamily A member 5